MKNARNILLLGIGLLLISKMLAAQQSTARIFGIVQREDGSAVAGVIVEAFSPKLIGKATTVTDKNGIFTLANLSPGTYDVIFTLPGFRTVIRHNLSLRAKRSRSFKVVLVPGSSEETGLRKRSKRVWNGVKITSKDMSLTRKVFDVLPKGRNFDGLIAIIPGATDEALLGGLSIAGASGGENMFYVDGQNTNSMFGGINAQNIVFDFVDEVQFKSSGYQAEFAGALGGVISVVTRSGGNEFHGDIVSYYSGSALRGSERDTTILDPLISQPTLRVFNYEDRGQVMKDARLEGGFGIGGFIIKDKLWFYVNALPVFRSTTQQAIYLVPSDPAHSPSDPFNGVVNKYPFKQTDNDLNFQLKLSAQPFKNMHLSLAFVNNYNVWEGGLANRDGSSADSYDFSALGYGTPNYSMSGNIDYTINNNFMVNFRAGYFFLGTTNKLDASQANANFEPQYLFTLGNTSITDVPEALRRPTGWQSRSDQSMTYPFEKDEESNFSTGVDLTYFLNLAGEHAWKAGIAFTRAAVNKNTLWNASQVIFTDWRQSTATVPFRASVMINGGKHSRVNSDFPATGQFGEFGNVHSDRLALYLQDSWTIANKLTLNFGVRLEQENVPSFNEDPEYAKHIGQDVLKFNLFDKFAPRLGFVYDVLGDSSLKVYGSYGIYYDVMDLNMSLNWFGGMRWISDNYYLNNPAKIFDIGKLKADGSRDYSMLTYRGSSKYHYQWWDYLDPDLKPMSQNEWTFGIEKKLNDDLSLSVRGTWRNLIRTIEDMLIEQPNIWTEYVFIGNPGEGWAGPYSEGGLMCNDFWPWPKAQRDYKALALTLEKRMSNNWLAGFNVTLSRLYGNYTGTVSADEAIANNGTGRLDGNTTSYFDYWWTSYKSNGKQELTNGLLPTDRLVVAKAYGSYVFPFGLIVGGVFNYLSGTPKSTEFYVDKIPGYYPLGRNDLGRTPNLWFLNLYAEYSLKFGKNILQFSVNVDNVTDNDTATWYYTCVNNRSVPTYWRRVGGSQLAYGGDTIAMIKNGYDLWALEGTWPQEYDKWTRDPRYNKPILYQLPISARLGVKFIF